jgi:hypothetical protein
MTPTQTMRRVNEETNVSERTTIETPADVRRRTREARRAREANAPLRAFVVGVKDCPEFERTIYARSHGKARMACWSAIGECWDTLKLTQVYARLSSRPPVESDRFRFLKEQRGLPFLRIGMRVTVDGRPGRVVDQGGGEMSVIFDGTDFQQACHPTWRVHYLADDGSVIRAYGDQGEVLAEARQP